MLPTRLRGAKTHNLQSLDLDILPGQVTVVTGVSGSGKSSLCLDTLYAEGQRRFVESFSPYARQFLERLQRPPMKALEPVGAGVAVDRSAPIKSSRSTVATMADLEPYLAGLFAKESLPHCPEHGEPAEEVDLSRAVDLAEKRFAGRKVLVTTPALVGDREEYIALVEDLTREGFRRVICDGELCVIDELKPSRAEKAGRVFIVLDRLELEEKSRGRLREALEQAFRRSKGLVSEGQARLFPHGQLGLAASLQLRNGLCCPVCARAFPEPQPGFFSYESPLGACDNCRGFGRVLGIDLDRVIPDEELSLADGAIRPWRGPKSAWERRQLSSFCKEEGIPLDQPWRRLSRAQRQKVIEGQNKRGRKNYWGVQGWFSWLEGKAYKMHVRVFLSRYRSYDPCPVCEGTRLNESSRWYKLSGLDLGEWHRLEVHEAARRLSHLSLATPHGRLLQSELGARLQYLERVGLPYLTLDRQARTLSGGESQRVTLTAALGTSLHNAMFVLDEPTVGLHASDVAPLVQLIRELAQRNNAVLIIEHDPAIISAADRVLELGPGPGEQGGRLMFDGSVPKARRAGGSTARALTPRRWQPEDALTEAGELSFLGASVHNLRGVDVTLPLRRLVAVSGPSGSGKSSLAVDIVYKALAQRLGVSDGERPGHFDEMRGHEVVARVQLVDQSPLGRTSRGNPATYTKCWDHVRKAFAREPEAEAHGFSASHFSFNVAGGRCEACAGEGSETVEMQFLADVSLVCPVCSGRRFKEEVIGVRHRGHTIADVLEMTVSEALDVFSDSAPVRRSLAPLVALGLGYLRLGQPLSTLSGGEAQRLKLARALAAPKPDTLYVLDEPSAGLHADEVSLVVDALRVLVRAGGTVLFVDHDLDLIAAADHVIEMGPGGGEAGGRIVFSGSPRELPEADTKTGKALAELQAAEGGKRRTGAISGRKPPKGKRAPLQLEVRGAREHTLQEVSVSIPHQKLTVVTGPSGSGKSTLAFDVVFAEGQRRFLETLTPYARRFLPTMPRPDVDSVTGVPPSIALEQRTTRIGARSTVATVTEVAHYLRLAFAKLGVPHCPQHDEPIGRLSPEELLALVQRVPGQGELLAPVVQARKGTYLDLFNSASRAGVTWAVADGKRVSTDDPPRLAKTKEHDIHLVLREQVAFKSATLSDLQEVLRWGRGQVLVKPSRGSERLLSMGGSCPQCGFAVGEIDPRFFSFNTTQGQCPTCEGTGLVSRPARCRKKKGVAEPKACPTCQGSRLSAFASKVIVEDWSYPDLTALTVRQVRERVAGWSFVGRSSAIAEPILRELSRRLEFLGRVGLDYLSLDRAASTLSGGEIQRLRLAAQLGAGLTGALYVLDEPTIGLHPRDTGKLIDNLKSLVQTGSTVVLVEHDEAVIRAAEHLIDLGPEGGHGGGRIVASGSPGQVLRRKASPTGRALRTPLRSRTRLEIAAKHPRVTLKGARQHNLDRVDFSAPLQRLTVVAGVSGSGKSTLVRQVFLPALQQKLHRVGAQPGPHDSLSGEKSLKRAVAVDQSPIGRTPRSVPATFLGIFDPIRKLFAKTTDAQIRGFDASRFSFNTPKGGRCTTCEGQGALSHEMSFLPDVITTCPSCQGLRFEPRTLEVQYLNRTIGQVLQLSAEEAVEVFSAHPSIIAPLKVLCDLGAGYITLGQGSHTLSGGEAQRLKLASELSAKSRHEATLYVLDEPTTGLHTSDVDKLIGVLDRLVQRGDTLVVIEHQPDLIAAADWVIELGPEGGPEGGKVVFEGPVAKLRRVKTATAAVLPAS